jgi:low affinity Fe/Cu permease
LYNHVIAPVIIQSLNGYWPSFDYQHLPLGEILDRSLPAKAWQMFSTQVSFFLGNLPFVVVLGLVAIVVWTTKRNVAGPPRERRGIRRALMSDGAIVTLLSVAALNVLLLLMVARHPYVYSIADHWFWYYPLTLDVVFLFGLATWVPSLGVGNRPGWKSALWISLVILLALNVAYYPQQRQIMIRSTDWFERQWAHSQFFVKKFEWMEAHGETFAPPSDTVGTPRDVDGFLEAVHAKHDALRHRPNSPAADSR